MVRNDELAWGELAPRRLGPDRRLAGAGPAGARARPGRLPRGARAGRDPGARRLPRPSGAGPRARRLGRARRGDRSRPNQPGLSSRRGALQRHPAGLSRGPLPLARRRARAAARARGARLVGRRHGHGDRRPRQAGLGRAVSSRVGRHRTRRAADRELPRADAGAAAARQGARSCARRPSPAAARPLRPERGGAHRAPRRRAAEPDAERAFAALFGDREHAFWLDSSLADPKLLALLVHRSGATARSAPRCATASTSSA